MASELHALYDYGNDDTALFVFPAGAANPQQVWRSGAGNWRWSATKIAAAAIRNGQPELCLLYDYGNDDTALFAFPAGGANPQQVWRSGAKNWDWDRTLVDTDEEMNVPAAPPAPPQSGGCWVSVPYYNPDGSFGGTQTFWENPCPYNRP